MRKYDSELIKKLSAKIGTTPNSVLQQISRRAIKHKCAQEAELANWARSEGISANSYIRKLPPHIQAQIYSGVSSNSNYSVPTTVLRIAKIGKKENEWYNIWWVQLLFAFLIVGVLAGTISGVLSQIFGAYLTNILGLTKP